MIEGHGDDLYRYGEKIRHNFSTNIISDVDHTGLMRHLADNMGVIASYPEPRPFTLEREIAESYGIDAANVVVTNGATDAIYRIAQIYRGSVSAVSRPTFREYQDACAMYSHRIEFFEKSEDIVTDADLIWLCNPNNPTGGVWPKDDLLGLAAAYPGKLMIVDQAYADYTARPVISVAEALERGNIVLLNSLTKRFSVPGLRIGYAIASAEVCVKLHDRGVPWAVNAPAITAARYLLRHTGDYPIPVERLHEEILRIADAFNSYGITTTSTDCNYMLCRLPEGRLAEDLKAWLVGQKSILIRNASNFEGLDESCFRVAAQSVEENDMLINAVGQWIHG